MTSSETGSDVDVVIAAKETLLMEVFSETAEALSDANSIWEQVNGFVFGFSLKENCGLTSLEVMQRLLENGFQILSSSCTIHSDGNVLHAHCMSRTTQYKSCT